AREALGSLPSAAKRECEVLFRSIEFVRKSCVQARARISEMGHAGAGLRGVVCDRDSGNAGARRGRTEYLVQDSAGEDTADGEGSIDHGYGVGSDFDAFEKQGPADLQSGAERGSGRDATEHDGVAERAIG